MNEERLGAAFSALHAVMARLRRDCPWDAAQTHRSLRRYLVEECHEVLAALDEGDAEALRGELGDLLFQIWFHSEVASEDQDHGFDLADVLDGIREKLVRRHPHVFAAESADDAAWVKARWEKAKMAEGRKSRLEGLPPGLPALLAAQVMQEKAAAVGFDWPDVSGVVDKVREEIEELIAELPEDRPPLPEPSAELVHEVGDVLFSVVNLARHLGVVPEDALREANGRFRSRFQHVERRCDEQGLVMDETSLDELEALWQEAKSREP